MNDQLIAEVSAYTTNMRQTPVPSTGFKPAIPANELPQTYALDCTAIRIGPVPVPTYKKRTYSHVSDGI